MDTPSTSGSLGSNGVQPVPATKATGISGVKLDDFLKLLIAELQNQDPLNPTDNDKILQQISQIRSIESTTQLGETLESVKLGQNLASASALIDRQIRALADDGAEVEGKVSRVTVDKGIAKLIVGDKTVTLSNLREIVAPTATAAPAPVTPTPTPTPVPAAKPGDLNGDGTVDVLDAYKVVTNWGATGAAAKAGDANGDGQVNIFDMNAISAKMGATP